MNLCKIVWVGCLCIAMTAGAQGQKTIRNPFVHDPVMAVSGDTTYLFSTGNGISVFASTDRINWRVLDPVFKNAPQWAVDLIPGYKGHTWAPDIIYYEGRYHLFYSCSTFGKNRSAIGHATSLTLNPDAPDFGWTDHGLVVESVPGRDQWNAIDPNIIVDEEGIPWMVFGSFWSGIKLTRLKPDLSGLAYPQEWVGLAARHRSDHIADVYAGDGAIEAPFVFRHGEYYYLFVSFDYCCQGENSTYKVMVGRSKKVKGPYLDRNGIPMAEGGGTLVVQGNKDYAGIGHNAVYRWGNKDYFISHAYSNKDDGAPRLIVREITWNEEDWPIVDWDNGVQQQTTPGNK